MLGCVSQLYNIWSSIAGPNPTQRTETAAISLKVCRASNNTAPVGLLDEYLLLTGPLMTQRCTCTHFVGR